MALFTDGLPNTIETLQAYDSAVLSVAAAEGIPLDAKLRLAQDQAGAELAAFLRRSGRHGDDGDLLRRVVVDDRLRRWHALTTLALVYQDAFHRQANDRHERKWGHYDREARRAKSDLFDEGVGMNDEAVPGADRPVIEYTAGGAEYGIAYFVAVSWLNDAGEEGAPSPMTGILSEPGESIVVRAVNPPDEATGWRLYFGLASGEACLQNAAPLSIDEPWVFSGGPLEQGPAPGSGAKPTYYVNRTRRLQRG